MQTKQLSLFLSLLLTLCLFHDTQAQQAGQIESMKLLTADTGWAATRNKLFWTTDRGASWKDITPNTTHAGTITSATFSDQSHGWVLLAHAGGGDLRTGFSKALFELASTTDAGASWSVKELAIPNPDPARGFSEETRLDFVDALHGWVLARVNGNTAMGGGALVATEDGGSTWKTLGVPAAGPIRFVTAVDGWLDGEANGEAGPALYVTRNGGKDWEPVALNAPPSFGAKVFPTYTLPEFADKDSGSMLVTFAQPNDESPELALFVTKDGGRTWNLAGSSQGGGASWRTAYAGGQWFAAGCPGRELTLLRSAGSGISTTKVARAASGAACGQAGFSISQISFANDTHGWLLSFGGELLATSDGGHGWSRITPPTATTARPLSRKSTEAPPRQARSSGESASYIETPSSNVSSHLGFDKFPVIPTISDMNTWMTSSPFYDVGIYLPGSKNKSSDPNLTPAWASAVQSQQGWGIMPIWFGFQSACACYVSKGQCVAFTNQINNNTTQATAQGVAEAKAAISSAQTLGVNPAIIYKDIENYYTSICNSSQQSAAALAVRAYVGGWDQQMHAVGLAGVYGNPAPASQDFTQASPIPDDVWVAKYTSPPQLTIWALGTLADSPNWTNGQRIHQVQQNLAQGWAATSYKVDPDIENATVVNANNGAKTPSYAYTSLTYPGSTQTCPMGINDMAGGAFISNNNPTSVGEIVGEFEDSQGQLHGFSLNGTTWAQIDYPGAVWTVATGINNAGQIVGAFWNSLTGEHGFKWNSGSPTTIDYPGANGSTEAVSINDAGQIVGSYQDSSSVWHGFLAYAGNFYSFSYPASNATLADGINGDAILTGHYTAPNAGSSYSYSPLPPSWTGSFSAISYPGGYPALMYGVNNDGEFTGYAGSATGNVGLTLSNDVFTSLQFPGQSETFMFSANDFGQIAGYYYSQSDLCVGFVAIPQ